SADGKTLTAVHQEGWNPIGSAVVEITDLASGKLLTRRTFPRREVSTFALSPDSRLLAEVAREGVRLFDAATGRLLLTLGPGRLPPGENLDRPLAFPPDGRALAAGVAHSPDGDVPPRKTCKIRLWELATGQELTTFVVPRATLAAFTPDGGRLAT